MKRIFLFLFILMLFSFKNVFAEEFDIPVCVKINDEYIKFENKPILIDGKTYLPVRFFCEAFSASVDWEEKTKTVTIDFEKTEIKFKIGDNTAYLNNIPKKIGGSAILVDGRTYLPVRFITESLGGTVNWLNEYYTVDIKINSSVTDSDIEKGRNYSDDEIYWLAKIISCESKSEPIKGKIGVGNVVLNRVKSEDYPDTIYSVIFDKKYGYQFEPVENGSIYNEPDQESYLAAKLSLEGENVVGNCKYFLNPDKATSFWIVNNKNYFTTIGSHDFYY